MITIPGKAKLKGWSRTRAQLLIDYPTYVAKAGEPILTSDGYLCRGDGVTQYQFLTILAKFNFSTGEMTISSMTIADTLAKLEAQPTGGTAGFYIDVQGGTGGWLFRVGQDLDTKIAMEFGCVDNMLYFDNTGIALFNCGLGFGTAGGITLTTGTYDGLNVTDTGWIYVNPSGGNIIINDLTGGVNRQFLFAFRIDTANTVTINHNSGSNQSFRTSTEVDIITGAPFMSLWGCSGNNWSVGGAA